MVLRRRGIINGAIGVPNGAPGAPKTTEVRRHKQLTCGSYGNGWKRMGTTRERRANDARTAANQISPEVKTM